ncbi:MAG TPA: BTAD domain-containing putative transcriptional regulator [Chloroflexota bacterium]
MPSSVGLLRAALAEQRALTETIDHLGASLEARLSRLGQQISHALELLDDLATTEAGAARREEVAVYCLGTFRVAIGGVPLRAWRPGKARSLFQYLVNHRGHPTARPALIEALWPDPDAATTSSLKVAVHALRQTLTRDGERAPVTVEIDDAGYRLGATSLWLDVEEFERYCLAGHWLEAHGQDEDALAMFARAADTYGGDFLDGAGEDWALFRREGLKDQYLLILARLADAALGAEDYPACIRRCQQLVAHDRCREETYRVLMLCHARLGQRGRVRRWYQLCARALRAELDVAPDPETDDLYRRAMRGHP